MRFILWRGDDLTNLYTYICEQSGLSRAGDYLDRIEKLCSSLADFSERGTPRADLGPGLRSLSLDRRLLIVYRLRSDDVEIPSCRLRGTAGFGR